MDRTSPDQLKDLHRVYQPFDRKRSQSVDLHEALNQSEGRCGQPDTTTSGELLHARCQMGRLADGGIVRVQVVPDGADHDFTRIEPDANLYLQTVRAAYLLSIASHRHLHSQASITGPQGVILVSHRRSKEGHDAIA
jgi:hypothetical protein